MQERLFTDADLKTVSQFVARDVSFDIEDKMARALLPKQGTWIATSQTNAFIVAFVDKNDFKQFEDYHRRFDTPFPALISPDYRDDVLIKAYDGIYIFKDNVVKNEYALVIDPGAGVILENHYQRVEYISKSGQKETVQFRIPLGFVIGVKGNETVKNLQVQFRRLTKAYLEPWRRR